MKKLGKILGWIVIVIAILLALLVIFSGDSEETSDAEQTEEVENVIFENDSYKVTFKGLEDVDLVTGTAFINLVINNNTDANIIVYLDNVSYNDEMAHSVTGVPNNIAPGKKSTSPYTLLLNDADTKVADIESVSFKVVFCDENMNTLYTTEQIDINLK